MQKPCRNPASRLSWLWALLPLLLTTALAVPLLDVDAFNDDEPASLLAAGIQRTGTWSLADTWENTSPRHAPGWVMLLSIWGPSVGWRELAVRALSFFVGLLTLAWIYRIGRDFFTPAAGLIAALLLSASVFHLSYMARAGAYALVALCVTICLWYYWRVALNPRQSERGEQAGLLLGSIGLLYSHYFGALLLPVLGLFHLLFIPKHRRWWRPVLLLGLATLVAALQIPFLLRGVAYTEKEDFASRVLAAPEILSHLLSYLTNGLVAPSPPAGEHLLLVLLLISMGATLLRRRTENGNKYVLLLVFSSVTMLALVIAINEVMRVFADDRIRYLMPLWPLTALLAGAGLWHLSRSSRRLVSVLLALWLALGAWLTIATDFRYQLGNFSSGNTHRVNRVMQERLSETDLIVFDNLAVPKNRDFFYIKTLGLPWEIVRRYREDPYASVKLVHEAYPYIWFLYLSKDRVGFADLPQALGRVLCERALDEWGFTLERYALHSVENCPDSPRAPGIRLRHPADRAGDQPQG